MRIPVIIQMQTSENGVAALAMILGYYKKYIPVASLREHITITRNGSSPEHILEAAHYYGLDGKIIQPDLDNLQSSELPLIIQWKKKHYCIIKKIGSESVTVADPARGEYKITKEKLKQLYTGTAISLYPSESFQKEGHPEFGMHMLIRRLKDSYSALVKILVLAIAGSVGSVFSLTPKKDFIDQVIKNGRMDLYAKLLITMALFFLFHTVISAVKTQVIAKESRKDASVSGAAFFKKMFSLPYSFFDEHSAGELIQRLENNISSSRSLLTAVVPKIMDAVMIFVYIVLMFSLNKSLAIMCIFVEIVYVIASYFLQEKITIANRSLITTTGQFTSSLLNGFDLIEFIKSNGMEQSFFNIWSDSQADFRDTNNKSFRLNAYHQLFSGLHNIFTKTILLFAGAYFIIQGSFTIGMMAVFESALVDVGNSLSNCISGFNSLFSLETKLERIEDIMNRESDISVPYDPEENPGKLNGSIDIKDVCYKYHSGDKNVIDHVSFTVNPGQVVAIVGESGCGKSTLLKIIGSYYKPSSGTVLYGGKERTDIPDEVFHASVASVDQDSMVFSDTVKSNIQLWDHTIEDYEIILAARDAHIHERIMQDKNQYYMKMSEKGRNFSGGERQRLELARSLAQTPVILCLDEFTSALDACTEDEIFKSIRAAGITCIIVAHRLSTVAGCDYIYVMDNGRITQSGTHSELMKTDGLYRKLLKVE